MAESPQKPTGSSVSQEVLFGRRQDAAATMEIKKPTPLEQAALSQIGWQQGQRIPTRMADMIGENEDAAPQVQSELSPEVAERLRMAVAEVQLEEQREAERAASLPEQPSQGAIETLQQIRSGSVEKLELEDDVTGKQPEQKEELGADTGPQHCPQCDWPLATADVVEVTDEDRRMFLASMLGGQQFRKSYSIMGGALQITVRTLSMKEIDLCYQQCAIEHKRELLTTPTAFFEQVVRYKTILQLTRAVAGEQSYRFPDSVFDWELPAGKDGDTVLPAIADQVADGFLRSESVYRIVYGVVMKFNRLVMRLEANVHNSDFWSATGQQA